MTNAPIARRSNKPIGKSFLDCSGIVVLIEIENGAKSRKVGTR
jgi:hypothetical protein